MTNSIVLLTEENRGEFLPSILPELHGRLAEPVIFGFGMLAGELDEPERPAGAIVCEYDAGIVTVLSVGVLPRFRRQQVGSRLVQYLAAACAQQRHLELVASSWGSAHDPDPAEQFFVANGFAVMQGESTRYVVVAGDIGGSSLARHLDQARGRSSTLVSLGELPEFYLEQFVRQFELSADVFDEVDLAASRATVAGGQVTSAVLLSSLQQGVVEVVYICSRVSDGRVLATTLMTALAGLYQSVPADTVIIFTPISDTVTRLAERLLQGCRCEVLHERQLYRSLLPMWDSSSQTYDAKGGVTNNG